ncbi:MAG: demethoxyubiquinone hydroxylase family protein [Peptococcales bacterium]|jgi:bacterioferritin
MNQHSIEKLNELLKGEHMAMQVYEKTKNLQRDKQVQEMIDKFAQDHKRHIDLLSQRIKELGGKPEHKAGLSSLMVDVTAMINSLQGPEHLLIQLYDGEDKGIHAYEDRIDELDPVSQYVVKGIMAEDHEHLKYFKARMEEEKKERQKH